MSKAIKHTGRKKYVKLPSHEKKASYLVKGYKIIPAVILLLSFLIFALIMILAYPYLRDEITRRSGEAYKIERVAIINKMTNLNAKNNPNSEDTNSNRVTEILAGSQINNETLTRVSEIPILIQGHVEISLACKEHAAGCLTNGKIHVLKVDARETFGWQIVTYDHELLHFVYETYSEKQKDKVNQLLYEADNNISNTYYREALNNYDKNNKGVWYSELFARIGTEIEEIPEGLNNYYDLVFINRMAIVNTHKRIIGFIDDLYSKCKNTGDVWVRFDSGNFLGWKNYCEDYVGFTSGLGATTKPY